MSVFARVVMLVLALGSDTVLTRNVMALWLPLAIVVAACLFMGACKRPPASADPPGPAPPVDGLPDRLRLALLRQPIAISTRPLTRRLWSMRRSIERCNQIIAELLEYSRARDLRCETQEVDRWLSELIDEQSIPMLEQQTMQAQSANIQGVSGASYTSQGFQQSLQGALSKLGLS